MVKAIVTVAALGLMWLGYIAWPLYDLYALVNAFEKRDVQTVVRHVYFDSVRRSLADQILAAYVQRTGVQLSPRLQGVAATALVIRGASRVKGYITRSTIGVLDHGLANARSPRGTTWDNRDLKQGFGQCLASLCSFRV